MSHPTTDEEWDASLGRERLGQGPGFSLLRTSLGYLLSNPVLLLPLALSWLIYASLAIYFSRFFTWSPFSFPERVAIVGGIVLVFSLTLTFACTFLLEMLQQMQRTGKPRLGRALFELWGQDAWKLLPIAVAWAVLWTLLLVLEALLSRKRDRESNDQREGSAEAAARTMMGSGSITLSEAFFEALQRGLRMLVFLILPAVAWQGLSPGKAVRKGLAILRAHPKQFLSGYALTWVASTLLFLPPGVVLFATNKLGVHLGESAWFGLLVYLALAWSLSMYLEQAFMAQLFLWNMAWEAKVDEAHKAGRPLPTLEQVQKPAILGIGNAVADADA